MKILEIKIIIGKQLSFVLLNSLDLKNWY